MNGTNCQELTDAMRSRARTITYVAAVIALVVGLVAAFQTDRLDLPILAVSAAATTGSMVFSIWAAHATKTSPCPEDIDCDGVRELAGGLRLASNACTGVVVLALVVMMYGAGSGVWTIIGASTLVQCVGYVASAAMYMWMQDTYVQPICQTQ
jgi:hypothetical protein